MAERARTDIVATLEIETDHREVIPQVVGGIIRARQATSLLDIGAGDVESAVALSSLVERYLAAESHVDRARRLRRAGLEVVIAAFPSVRLGQSFDVVLCSHAIPDRVEEYKPFLAQAWKCVALDGCLLVATFLGVDSELTRLVKELRPDWNGRAREEMSERLREVLSSFGVVREIRARGSVWSVRREEMVQMLTLSIGGSATDQTRYRERLEAVVSGRRDEYGKYVFPREHLILQVAREAPLA